MNNFLNNKNSKVKVMVVHREAQSDESTQNARSRTKGKFQKARHHSERRERQAVATRLEHVPSDKPYGEDSPWRNISPPFEDNKADHQRNSSKSVMAPEQLHRQRAEEARVYGENACIALFACRPEAIVRAWFVQETTLHFRETLRWMAANRKAYHVIDEQEMQKVTGTAHHGGVCFLIKKRDSIEVTHYLTQAAARQQDCVLALEEVSNPYNLGGIMRTCAHFGVTGVLLQNPALLASGAAIRTAEGGAEYIQSIETKDFDGTLTEFRRAGYQIVAASTHCSRESKTLTQVVLPQKILLLLSHEERGRSKMKQGDITLAVRETGQVVTLNISVTTGILLAEWRRQNAQLS